MKLSTGTSTTAMRIIIFCVLSILGGTSVAMDETAPTLNDGSAPAQLPGALSLHGPSYSALINPEDQFQGGKRAYVYRSEFKRLPLYQFGLGKRWASGNDIQRPPFSFGLGKRTRHYSFGLGKRSSYDDSDDSSHYNLEYIPNPHYNLQKDALDNYLETKRTGGFNFGLGKRVAGMSGDEKLPLKNSRDKYLFGLGKRLYVQDLDNEDEDEES